MWGSGPLAPYVSDRLSPSLSFPTCEAGMTLLPSGKHQGGCGREGVLQPAGCAPRHRPPEASGRADMRSHHQAVQTPTANVPYAEAGNHDASRKIKGGDKLHFHMHLIPGRGGTRLASWGQDAHAEKCPDASL